MTTAETETEAERYRRLARGFTERVEAVPTDRWDDPSPCEDWSARDVLGHVVESQSGFVTKGDLSIPPGPSVQDDPAAAWAHVRDGIQDILDDPDKADRTYEGMNGPSTIAAAIGSFFSVDLVIHGWDIAHATGGDDAIPHRDVTMVSDFVAGVGDMMRSPGGFGAALEAPEGADEQTTLLAFLGRRAWD